MKRHLAKSDLNIEMKFTLLEIADLILDAEPETIAELIEYLANHADKQAIWDKIDELSE